MPQPGSRTLLRAVEASDLSKAEKTVLRHLILTCDDLVYVSVNRTAEKLGIADRTVRRSFREFEERAILILLEKEKCGSMPRVYRMNPKSIRALEGGQMSGVTKAIKGGQMSPVEGGQMSGVSASRTFVRGLRGDKCPGITSTPEGNGNSVRLAWPPQELQTVHPYQADEADTSARQREAS